MKILKILIIAILFFTASNGFSEDQQKNSALQEIKITLDVVINTASKFPGDSNKEVRRAELRKILEPRFNFEEMSRRSLGTHWNDRTPAEQKEFIDVFSDLLARTYVARIETVKPGMVQFESESIELPKALVKTTVKVDGDVFPIDYKLLNDANGWKVYDVIIENIGLVANYRNEFASIIRREEFSGLMKSLREKLAKK